MLLGGAAICASCLIIVSALNIAYDVQPTSVKNAALGLIFIWYFFFGLVWSPLVWITCTEVASARAREPTLSAATFSGFTVGLIVTLVSPYLQNAEYGNMGSSIGFLWGGFTVISIVFVYFLIPELKGIPLELIDELFDARTPTLKFHKEALAIMAERKSGEGSTLPHLTGEHSPPSLDEKIGDKV